jgi:hypothetical protein
MSVPSSNGSVNAFIFSNTSILGKKQGDDYVPFFRLNSDANIGIFQFTAKK